MGRTLYRYVLAETARAVVGGVLLATFVLTIMQVMGLVDLVFARGVPASEVGRLFAFMLPSYLELALPMSLMLAVVVTCGRLSRDNEILALGAGGIGVRAMLPTFVTVGAGVALLGFLLAAYTRPWAERGIEETLQHMARTRFTAALRPGVFSALRDDMVIYVEELDPEGNMTRLLLSDEREATRPQTIVARHGRLVSDETATSASLFLREGTILAHHYGPTSYDKTDFEALEIHMTFDSVLPATVDADSTPASQLAFSQLLAERERKLAAGGDAIEESLELHRKFAIAAASLLLPMFGMPLGIVRSRSVYSRGMVVSVVAVLVYYFVVTAAMTAARQGMVPAAAALWLPNVLLAAAGAFAFARVESSNRSAA